MMVEGNNNSLLWIWLGVSSDIMSQSILFRPVSWSDGKDLVFLVSVLWIIKTNLLFLFMEQSVSRLDIQI